MLATVASATLVGIEGRPITVEVHVSSGIPGFTVVGLPDASCREARDRVRAAMLSSGLRWPNRRVTVNLAPSSLRKGGAGLDLPIAVALLVADDQLPAGVVEPIAFLGELGLDGRIRNVAGTLPLVDALTRREVVVAAACVAEAGALGRHQIRCVPDLRTLVAVLRGQEPWPDLPEPPEASDDGPVMPDLADVRGQPLGRLAVEVAAAGGHHLLLLGPPGAGKTMLARRLPGLLPPLTATEALEVSRIHSAAGLQLPSAGLLDRPPLRAPHHSASMVSLIGGGTARMRPGEISCAHNPVKYCSSVLQLDTMSKAPGQAAIYCRISRDIEGKGLGVERQERECRQWCERAGWQVAAVYSDNDISAYKRRRRPGYERMLDDIRAGRRDGLVVFANDRLTRHPRELEDLIDVVEAARLPIYSLNGGEYDLTKSEGRATARLIGVIARMESERKSDRSAAKHRQLREQGRSAGGARPFGIDATKTSLVEAEAAMIRKAAEDVLAGRSLRAICREWNASGVRTVKGGAWMPIAVLRILRSEWVEGKRAGRPAVWPAILDEVTAHRVRAMLADPTRRKNGGQPRTLLSGVAVCGMPGCGHHLVSRPKGDGRPCYVCASDQGGCGKIRILAKDVTEDLLGRLWAAVDADRLNVPEPVADPVEMELEALGQRAAMLGDMVADGEMSREEYKRQTKRLDAKKAELAKRLAARETQTAQVHLLAGLGDLRERWSGLDVEDQRRHLVAACERIEIGPAVKGRNFYSPDRLRVTWRV